MTFSADEKGLHERKLFKKILIPYEDIEAIRGINMQKTIIITKDGKEYMDEDDYIGLLHRFPIVSDMIPKYNIAYKYEGTLEANMTGIMDETEMKNSIDESLEGIKEEIKEVIREKLGDGYSPEFIVRSVHNEIMLYIRLLKDGNVIDAQNGSFDEPDEGITEVFDFTLLAYMLEWDSEETSAKYVVLDEHDEIMEGILIHCEEYHKSINRIKLR